MAGEYAARKGAEVVVVDKKKEIGRPVRCAEGLGAINLELLGLKSTPDFVVNTVNKAVFFSPKGRRLEIFIPYKEFSMHILDRSLFEKHLASRLKGYGGRIMLGTTVTGVIKKEGKIVGVSTTGEEINAKIIIGADGVESRVGRWCGLATRLKLSEIYSAAQHTVVDMDGIDDQLEIYFGSKFAPGGYAWVFPKGNKEVNLGLGMLASFKRRPIELLKKFTKKRANSAHSTRLLVGCIPSTLPLSKTVKGNILLVGDAARQTNALSGGGIANALVAGKIAGEVAGKVVVENQKVSQLEEYDRSWRWELEKELLRKFKQRKHLENDKKAERLFRTMRLLWRLKPIIPKAMAMRWVRPDF